MKNNIYFKPLLIFISFILFIPQIIMLIIRLIKNKEKLERVLERISIPSQKKLDDLVWIHAASVGETNIAFSLIEIIRKSYKSQKFLLTTGTINSEILAETKITAYNNLNSDIVIIHQMLPMDNFFITKFFLNYWNPKIGIFIESELWPNTLFLASKKFPLILVNARMSERSFNRWLKFSNIISSIAGCFSETYTQTRIDYERYTSLGFKNVKQLGNIKYAQKDAVINNLFLEELNDNIEAKKIIFAASTHDGEEKIILEIYKNLKSTYDIFLIIAPRHPSRLQEITNLIESYNLNYLTRSSAEKINNNTDLFILDTIGEMDTVFKLKPITFMGGSFTIGGHNILEPARYESPIIFGPKMYNFQEIADEFISKKAAIEAKNKEDLQEKIESLIKLPDDEILTITNSALNIIKSKQEIEKNYLKEISKYFSSNS